MRRAREKPDFKSVVAGARTASARARDAATKTIGDSRRRIESLESELRRLIAPTAAFLRRRSSEVSTRLQPVMQPLSTAIGKVAPYVASIPVGLATAGAWTLGGLATVIEGVGDLISFRLRPWSLRVIERADHALTPVRMGAIAGVVTSGLMIGSQFLDYRGVAVGAPLYQGQIAVDAPAPVTATAVTGSAHFWVVIPLALVGAILALWILRTGNRRFGLALVALGVVVVAIAIAVDLPQALDPVNALPYSDASTRLLGGFWAELFAGISLAIAGVVVMRGNTNSPRAKRVGLTDERTGLVAAGGS